MNKAAESNLRRFFVRLRWEGPLKKPLATAAALGQPSPMRRQTFQFQPRWKEELVVIGPGGSFVLELPMGLLSAYLPTEATWPTKAPAWAADLWPVLRSELEEWCRASKADLIIDETASVW